MDMKEFVKMAEYSIDIYDGDIEYGEDEDGNEILDEVMSFSCPDCHEQIYFEDLDDNCVYGVCPNCGFKIVED